MQALGFIETKGLIAAVEGADAMLKAAEVTLYDKTYVGGGLVSIAVMGGVAAVKAAVEAGVAAVNQINSSLLVSSHVIPRPHEELDSIITPVKSKEIKTPAITEMPESAVSDIESADRITGEKEDIPVIVSTDKVPTETAERLDVLAGIEIAEVETTDSVETNIANMTETAEVIDIIEKADIAETEAVMIEAVETNTADKTEVAEVIYTNAQADIEATEAVIIEAVETNTLAENILHLKEDKINKVTIDHIVSEYGWEKALEILNSLKVTKLRNLAREYKNLKIAGRKISKADKKVLLTEFKDYYGKN